MTQPLADAFRSLGFEPGKDFECQDDGEGPYLKEWRSQQPQPTKVQLDTAPAYVPDPLSRVDVVLITVAFNHENRIRALESKAPVTLAQFKSAVKALL